MIRKSILLLILITFFSCSPRETGKKQTVNNVPAKRETIAAFRQILDSANVSGSILVYDAIKDIYYSNNFNRCEIGHLPASTFKIPNSIIALETGVIADDSTMIRWDGQKRRLTAWEQDLVFRDAFHYSCVPCYQDISMQAFRAMGII